MGALVVGFFVTILFWYLVFFRTGSASKEYQWEKSVIDNFNKKEMAVSLPAFSRAFWTKLML